MSISMMWQVWGDHTIESRGDLFLMLAVAALAPDVTSRGATVRVVAQMVRSSELSVRRTLERLVRAGRVERVGQRYRLVSQNWDWWLESGLRGVGEMNDEKSEGKSAWISAAIWTHPDLSWLEKALLTEIDSRVSGASPCCATNEYLAKRIGVSVSGANTILFRLQTAGFVLSVQCDERTPQRVVRPDYSGNPETAKQWIDRCFGVIKPEALREGRP